MGWDWVAYQRLKLTKGKHKKDQSCQRTQWSCFLGCLLFFFAFFFTDFYLFNVEKIKPKFHILNLRLVSVCAVGAGYVATLKMTSCFSSKWLNNPSYKVQNDESEVLRALHCPYNHKRSPELQTRRKIQNPYHHRERPFLYWKKTALHLISQPFWWWKNLLLCNFWW